VAANRRLRLGFVDASHLHFRNLIRQALECPEIEVVGTAIEHEALRAQYAGQYPAVPSFATAEELYDRGRPEAIVTCADNRAAAETVVEAARRGVHVMKEKPMAATLWLAEQMATTAARAGVRLMVNWPTNWSPALHQAKKLVDEGRIGRLWQVHHRAGHGGPPADYQAGDPQSQVGWGWLIEREKNGGGAFVDFCSYGAVISRWLMGQPSRVMALGGRYAKEFFTVEDNAVLVLGYQRGHSICEGTWTQPAVPIRIPTMLYGTEGAIAILGQGELQVAVPDPSGQRGATRVETIEAAPLPDHYRSGPAYFAHCLLDGQPFEGIVSAELSRDAQEILEAGLESMEGGHDVGLPLGAHLR
jgi:predicted dehydrogenase